MKCAGRSFSAKAHARCSEGQALAAVDALDESGQPKTAAAKRSVCPQPAGDESLERLWTYRYEGAMLRYLQSWIDQLRWQRLEPFQKLAYMLLDHLDGILNYCRTKVRFGVVEAINGNIKTLLRRGRGYKNLGYLLLKAQRMAVTKTEFIILQKAA
jgi:transposase